MPRVKKNTSPDPDTAADPGAVVSPDPAADPAESKPAETLTPSDLSQAAADHVADNAPAPNVEAMLQAEEERRKAEQEADSILKSKRSKKRVPNSKIGTTTEDEKNKKRNAEEEAAFRAACRASGEATIDSVVLLCTTLGGPEWWWDAPHAMPGTNPPIMRDEQAELRRAYADTFEHYGWKSTPTWLGLVVATGAYVVPRLNRPQTRARVLSLKEKIAAWWAMRKVRREGQRLQANQPPPPPPPPATPPADPSSDPTALAVAGAS